MPVSYFLGKGLRDSCFPYLTIVVFGAPANQLPLPFNFVCAPEILFPTTVFDLTSLAPDHEVAVALVVLTGITGGKRVQFDWYRSRDSKLLRSGIYTIPPTSDGSPWPWYYSFWTLQYTAGQIAEDGNYQVSIQVEAVGSTTIAFSVTGITPVPSPTVGTLQLPAAVRSTLDSSWCNLAVGEWGILLGINLPPFGFEPGRWVLKGLDVIINALNQVITWADKIWDKAYNAFVVGGNALTKINDWVSYASAWWNGLISAWWSGAQEWVKVWVQDKFNTLWTMFWGLNYWVNSLIQKLQNLTDVTKSWQTWLLGSLATISPINTLIAGYNRAENFYSVYLSQIGDFFKDPPGFIFDRIDDWLNERVE